MQGGKNISKGSAFRSITQGPDNRPLFTTNDNIINGIMVPILKITGQPTAQQTDIQAVVKLVKDLAFEHRGEDVDTFNKFVVNEFFSKNYRDSWNGTNIGTPSPPPDVGSMVSDIDSQVTTIASTLSDQSDTLSQMSSLISNTLATKNTYIVHVNSLFRDFGTYPSSNNYKVSLIQNLNSQAFIRNLPNLINIDTIEIISVQIPNIYRNSTNNFKEPFLYLLIDEFIGDIYTSTYDQSSHAILQFREPERDSQDDFILADTKNYKFTKKYQQSSSNSWLTTLTIRFLNQTGVLINFGTDNYQISSLGALTSTKQVLLITTVDHSMQVGDQIYLSNIPIDSVNDPNGLTRAQLLSTAGFTVISVPATNEISFDLPQSPSLAYTGSSGTVILAKYQNNLALKFSVIST